MAKKIGEPGTTDSVAEAAPAAARTAESEAPASLATGTTQESASAAAREPNLSTIDSQKSSEEIKAGMEKAIKTAEELVSFGQGNLEAIVKSGQIWVAGVQDLTKQVAASAQAHVDQTMATLKALAGARSLKEAIDLHASLTRSSVEKVVAETGKLTDASLKLAEQVLAPLTARVTLAAEKFGRAF